MKTRSIFLTLIVSIFISSAALACDCEKNKAGAPTTSGNLNLPNPTFENLKKLAGNWEITITENGKKELAKASYEVTSGGNAVLEKIMIGTPHEMISVYHNDGSNIAMTHYCMLPNTPRMTLKKTEPGKMFFEMKGKDGIKSKKEHHMHSVELVWNNDNELTQNWVSVKDGKKEPATVFNWKRAIVSKK
jgi:hypothetical protein